jgi:hypothetical protein
MPAVPRITPQEGRAKFKAGDVLLVCAYEEPENFQALQLDAARGHLPSAMGTTPGTGYPL